MKGDKMIKIHCVEVYSCQMIKNKINLAINNKGKMIFIHVIRHLLWDVNFLLCILVCLLVCEWVPHCFDPRNIADCS